jgi:hypothetical protein
MGRDGTSSASDDWRDHLAGFHAERPDVTDDLLARSRQHRSLAVRLARRGRAAQHPVLDLGAAARRRVTWRAASYLPPDLSATTVPVPRLFTPG